jgi:ADP-ribose pyrophosphatase YjhB (NUDIX family)
MEEQNWKKVSVFEDDEIPYEVRMKHLIEGYRRDLKRLNQLARYAKGLEEENLLLQKKIENTEKWIKSHPDKEELIRKMDLEIRQLKGTLTKSYPKRVVELKYIKKKVRDIEDYMRYLQSLLDDNDISYEERKPSPSPKVEDLNIEDIDILAVRGPNENYEVDEQYCYKYPRPSVTADCIVFTRESTPQVLLIERGDEPFMGCWAFPGGFLNMDETTEQCAIRELKEETGLEVDKVKEIGTYSKVDRDPRGRTITVAYLAVVESQMEVKGQDDAAKAQWFPIDALPDLAFDHDEIMKDAIEAFKNK